MMGWLNMEGKDIAGFVVATLVGLLAGTLVPPGAWSVYTSILVSYHVFLVWLLLSTDKKVGASLSPIGMVVTHLAFISIIIPLGIARKAIPFFGIFRYSIAALAIFERGWLFSGKIEAAKPEAETTLSVAVATATGEDYEEWCRYLAQRKPSSRAPGVSLQTEYEQWLLARQQSRFAASSGQRPVAGG